MPVKPQYAILTAAALVLGAAHLSAYGWGNDEDVQGNGQLTEHQQQLGKVDEVSIAIPAQVSIQQGDSPALSIQAEENILAHMDIEAKGDELRIRAKKGFDLEPSEPIKVQITLTGLEELSLAGSGDAKVAAFAGKTLDLSVAGSGDIVMAGAEYKELDVNVAGSGDVRIDDGSANSMDISIAGSGSLTSAVKAAKVEVSIAGSGDVAVHAADELEVSIAGSGNVDYYGSPKLSQSILGSGKLVQKGQ